MNKTLEYILPDNVEMSLTVDGVKLNFDLKLFKL